MVALSSWDADLAKHWVESVPTISPAMMSRVAAQLNNEGLLALFFAPFIGLPYKTFAVQVYHSDVALWSFLLATIPARLSRFVLTVWLCAWLAKRLRGVVREGTILILWGGFWLIFYFQYFHSVAND
jgi:hypothetical protein